MKATDSLRINLTLTVMVILSIGSLAAAEPNDWIIIQLTNNSYDDQFPKIDGQNVVWHGSDGNDFEIFLYNIDSNTTTQLTNNSYNDYNPCVSGSNVAWSAENGMPICFPYVGCIPTNEIHFYDGNTTTQLTHNNLFDSSPKIYGNHIAWHRSDFEGGANSGEIMFFDGNTTKQLTNNGYIDQNPRISGTNVVWEGISVLAFEIFLYNIDSNTTTQLTNNNGHDNLGGISGSNVVWTYDHDRIARNGDEEIFFYDGNSTIQLTNNSYEDGRPQVSGSNVIWNAKAGGGSDYEVFYNNGTTTTRLTSNDFEEDGPSISDSNAVWAGSDGSDNEIFAYDGTAVSQVTDNSIDDIMPQISGLTIAWNANDGNDYEIFLAVPRCYPFKKSFADYNRDCIVSFEDLAIFLSEWLACNRKDCGN